MGGPHTFRIFHRQLVGEHLIGLLITMPELPEVEAQRLLIERQLIGFVIEHVIALEQGGGARDGQFDNVVLAEQPNSDAVVSALQGLRISGARRKGKQLWMELTSATDDQICQSLLVHFGLTGRLVIKESVTESAFVGDGRQLPDPSADAWPPPYTKLELVLSDGDRSLTLAYTDPRRMGRILLRGAHPQERPPLSLLASDPISDPPSVEDFKKAFAKTSTPVKAALIDQRKIVCGIGAWVADAVRLTHAHLT